MPVNIIDRLKPKNNGTFPVAERIDIGGSLVTEGSFTIALDPTAGTDPADIRPITSQARSDQQGIFKTFDAITDSLSGVRVMTGHTITIEIVDGTHAITSLGNWSQIIDDGGQVEIQPATNLHIRIAGTPLITVLSSTAKSFTANAATGLGVNTQRGQLIRGISAPNAGFIRPCRSHTDTVFNYPTQFEGGTPAVGNTFEFVQCGAILTGMAGLRMIGPGIERGGASQRFIRFTGVELRGDLSDDFDLEGIQIQFNDMRFDGVPMLLQTTTMFWEGGVSWDGNGAGSFGWIPVTMQSDSIFQPLNSGAGVLIRDGAFWAIGILDGSQASIFRITADDIQSFAFISAAYAVSNFADAFFTFSSGNLQIDSASVEHFLNFGQPLTTGGGRAETVLFSLANAPTGSVGDILLDNREVSWAFVDAEMPAPSSIVGFEQSRFIRGAA